MTIGAIARAVKRNRYQSLYDYISDWRLVFENARTFNQKNSNIYRDACFMEDVFNRTLAQKAKELHFILPSDFPVTV
jgi:hypothetical protein